MKIFYTGTWAIKYNIRQFILFISFLETDKLFNIVKELQKKTIEKERK